MKPDRPLPRSNRVMAEEEPEWIAGARAGNADCFRKLVERHQAAAVNLAFRMLRSRSDAEEVAQDAFVRAWRALPEFRGESRFGTWLYRIVVRQALDRVERLKVRARRETDLDGVESSADPAGGTSPDLEAAIERRRLERLMDALNDRERAAITLYYHHDRSVEEVAATLDVPSGTVKTLLSRARAKLRTRLEGRDP